jgi:hypothetical protein
LISFGDAGEVKGEVLFPQGLFPSIQNLMDSLFFRNLAGEKENNRKQKVEEVSSHFFFSNSSPG